MSRVERDPERGRAAAAKLKALGVKGILRAVGCAPDAQVAQSRDPREYEVRTLVADRRSNREIGAALSISDRTAQVRQAVTRLAPSRVSKPGTFGEPTR
jgi:DNA-binding NarL/FixJ family response regulator